MDWASDLGDRHARRIGEEARAVVESGDSASGIGRDIVGLVDSVRSESGWCEKGHEYHAFPSPPSRLYCRKCGLVTRADR